MKHFIYKLDDYIAACEKGLVVVLFAGLVFLIVFNIITRNLFHVSFQKLLEFSPSFVLWLALLGSTLGLKYQRHIRLELLLRFCSSPVRSMAGAITGLFGAAVMGILFYTSLGFVGNEIALFGNWGWLSVIFPLFFALSCFRYLTLVIGGPRRNAADPEGSAVPEIDKASLQ